MIISSCAYIWSINIYPKEKKRHAQSIGKYLVSKGGRKGEFPCMSKVFKIAAICKNRKYYQKILNMVNHRPVAPLTKSLVNRPSGSSSSVVSL